MHATLGSTDSTAKALPRHHAVVVGGGMAGMLAARVLADHFEQVTLLERDHLPETPSHRKGLPQGRHVHVLLERGQMVLEWLLPGLTTDLLAAGALLLDNSGDLATLTPFGWGLRFHSGLQLLACSRDLIDWGVRRRVAARPNVRLRQEVDAAGLVAASDGQAVAGVRLRPRHGGTARPVEGGRWLVTLTGGDGDYPPTDEAGFLDGARTLRIPDLYEAIRDAEPLGPIVGYRATENRLRHYERGGCWPEGLVALGDAVCALNPVYGQGMTTAVLGAEVLDRCLRRSRAPRGLRPGTGRKFQRELARTIAAPWLLATGTDYRGPDRRGTGR